MLTLSGLVFATLATVVARQGWIFDAFTHFRAQYAVCGLALAALLGLVRSRWAVVAALLALWHGWAWWDVAASPRTAECDGRPISIVAFNLEWSNPRKAEAVAALRGLSADLVMVAENWRDWDADLEVLAQDFPFRTPADWRDADRPTLFSKLPILESETLLPFADQAGAVPPWGRAANLFSYERAELDLGAGMRLTVFAVHAPYPLGAEVTVLHTLYLRRLAFSVAAVDGPAIVLGDFNTAPWSPYYRDLIEDTNLTSASGGHIATWPVWSWILRVPIDHILVRGGLAVLDARRGPDLGSDHFPIVASLCLEIAP